MFPPRENRCVRFQANIFNRRKCQNCFRPAETHTLRESQLHTSKPVKAGWLLLAPEGIEFLNPAHKNRKWQRRYFMLYEHGFLRYALDERPGTLPQGSVYMSQCTGVLDASSQTSFCNSLCLHFSERDYYIRTEDAENISRWREILLVHSNAAKTNQKKRRREETLSLHYLKKHVVPKRTQLSASRNSSYILETSCPSNRSTNKKRNPENSINSVYSMNDNVGDLNTRIGVEDISVGQHCSKETSGRDMGGVGVGAPPHSSPGVGQQEDPEELNGKGAVQSRSRLSHDKCPNTSSVISSYLGSTLGQVPACFSTNAAKRREGVESGYSSLEKTRSDEDTQTGPSDQDSRRAQVISQFEQENGMTVPDGELCSISTSTCFDEEHDEEERANHSTTRTFARGHGASGVSASTCRRSKSLERGLAEDTPTPDLLNFKKGWMMRLEEDGKWRRHWFVLANQHLRFYRDSVAEEAADLDGEINLSTCYDITDFPVQRNYGFQIHTKDGVFTLCAMTHGIRRNWIQAVMRNVQTSVAPDVTCSLSHKVPIDMISECKWPSASNSSCSEKKRSSVNERRREGRYKTFDWAEFSHMRKKRETLSRQSEMESEFVCDYSVPPAPAASPEEPPASSIMVVHSEVGQTSHCTKLANSSPHMGRSSIVPGKPSDQKKAEVDGVDVFNDISNTQMEAKKETGRYTSPSPATFSSLSVQTEWQWELEFQTLHRQLKAMYERSEREAREFKISEARLQTELSVRVDYLRETEAKLQKTEATLSERENALEKLQSRLEEVLGRLKVTEEAQALKDVHLQRHLRLLEESQERERRSLSDSLEHAEKRGKELQERLMQTEAMVQKMPTGGIVEQLERKCQELQNQLDESDSELSRLQTRLQNEETLYYDMEHNYEQVCEELEFVRGTLLNCERVCEERFKMQLEQQQEKLNRREQELQEVFLKVSCSGMTLKMTEHNWLKDPNRHLQENPSTKEQVRNFWFGDLEKQPVSQGDESEQVMSVIQALESKLCDSEERLQGITVHLQQQQRKLGDEVGSLKVDGQWGVQVPNDLLGPGTRGDIPDGKHCEIILEKTSTNTKVNLVNKKMLNFDLQEGLQEEGTSPEKQLSQAMTSKMLFLEALVIQKMASALEHPTKHLLEGISQLRSQTMALRESCDGRHEGPLTRNYSQLFSSYQEIGEAGCSLDECEIYSMCMKAELAYLTYTNHLHNLEEEHGLQPFNVPFYLGSKVAQLDAREETSSKTGLWLSDASLPELVPCKGEMQGEKMGYCPRAVDKDSLVVELQAHARSLQALFKQLHPLEEDAGVLSELSPVLLRTVLFQAIQIYVTSRLHVAVQQQVDLLRDQWEQAVCQGHRLEGLLHEQAEHYEEKLREDRVVIEVSKLARVSAETAAQIKAQEVQQLKVEFEKKLQELQRIHEEELTRLSADYTLSQSQTVTPTESNNGDGTLSVVSMKERIRELELQIRCLEDEIQRGDANTLRQAYEKNLETLKVTCELGFNSMEQSHQRVIEEMQRQHQIEVEQLLEEKDRVLQEETNATIAAIEAMRKAHKEELEKSQKAQQNGASTDVKKLRAQFKDELDSLHRELEVLSEQYSKKCLENAHLNRAIEAERQALSSVEGENQELHTRNQELNKRLVAELSLMQSCVNGGVDPAEQSQGKDVIQLEVALRVKDSEIQCLKQEISSLKEELQAASRHCKKLLNELSVSGVKCQTACVKRSVETFRQRSQSYEVMKSRSNPDFMKNCTKPNPPTRSKSLREHLSVQERKKLFESGSK